MKQFPKTLYVQAGSESTNGAGREYFGKDDIENLNDGDGACHGEEIAVYELKVVQRVEVTRKLVGEADV